MQLLHLSQVFFPNRHFSLIHADTILVAFKIANQVSYKEHFDTPCQILYVSPSKTMGERTPSKKDKKRKRN